VSVSRSDGDKTPAYNNDDILCHCMSIKRSDVIPVIKGSRDNLNLDSLVGRTGVGSVCMGCHPLLEEMMGKPVWTPVKIISIQQASNDARIYRFESFGEIFHPAKAGQHIIVQAYINGVWEIRRYTLTTVAEETAYREIIIQREPTGKVSSWFHQISEPNTKSDSGTEYKIRISQPMGNVTPDLISQKRLVCLVGGIGITPVIAFLRTINRKLNSARQIIVDHSVLNKDRLIIKSELDELAAKNDKIHLNYRQIDSSGYINQSEISELVAGYPNCEFYVCGPPSYSNAVLEYLNKAGVGEDAISIELFSSPTAKKIEQSKTYFYLGIGLFLAFLFQEFFQLKLPWLETLQAQENYKIYSGLFVVLYMASQFIMPYNKSCEIPHACASIYHQHKLRGAFAPLIFFIHSTQFGVAYLFMLSLVYFSNLLLGLFNHERIINPILRISYFKIWLPIHIILSVLTVALIAFHVYVVASY
jgi:ferredoxin-NADP reductase